MQTVCHVREVFTLIHDGKILIGMAGVGTDEEKPVYIYPEMANRHGLISGATGTGKTVTLRVMAEATTQELCEEKVDAIIDSMREAGMLIRVK